MLRTPKFRCHSLHAQSRVLCYLSCLPSHTGHDHYDTSFVAIYISLHESSKWEYNRSDYILLCPEIPSGALTRTVGRLWWRLPSLRPGTLRSHRLQPRESSKSANIVRRYRRWPSHHAAALFFRDYGNHILELILTATHIFSINSGLVLTAASALKNQQSPNWPIAEILIKILDYI